MKTEKLKAEIATPKAVQPCVTRFELAELLHVSVRTVDRMIAASEIRVRRVRGKVVRFLRSDVEEYINGGSNGGGR
jgi:excisionase family DNA binding protein